MIKTILCAAAIVAAPVVASATTVAPGASGVETGLLFPGASLSFLLEPTENMVLDLTVTGFGTAASLAALTFGYSPIASEGIFFTDYISFGFASLGAGALPEVTTSSPFYVYVFANTATAPVQVSLTYATEGAFEEPAPVPLPAAGGLLALALAGMGGVAATRRRKA